MLKDMQKFEGFEQQIDYFQALKQVEENVKLVPPESTQNNVNEDEDYLESIIQMEE